MKKRLVYNGLLVALMCSCGDGTPTATATGADEEVTRRVESIYTHVCEVFNAYSGLDDDASALYDSCRAFDERYLTASFQDLMRDVERIDSLYYPNSCGFFDYNHWVQGQDWEWEALSYRVDSTWTDANGDMRVRLHLKNGRSVAVELPMAQEDGEWKIADFITFAPAANSVRKMMEDYVEVEYEADPD